MQIENIYLYSTYLQQRTLAFRELGIDHAKSTMANKIGKLRRLSVDNGLLKQTVIVQKVLSALLKCNVNAVYYYCSPILGREWLRYSFLVSCLLTTVKMPSHCMPIAFWLKIYCFGSKQSMKPSSISWVSIDMRDDSCTSI